MNKNTTWILHVAVWLMLFLSPLLFSHEQTISLVRVAAFSIFPLCMMTVFYTNYLWLVPRYYIAHEERFYWIFNMIMILVLAVLMQLWMHLLHPLFPDDGRPHPEPSFLKQLLFVARNIFNLSVVLFIATSMEISSRWHQMEDERIEMEAARKEAELANLRSQINPHFLLNTLNNIYALTAFDTEKAQKAIMELSKMLRHMLYDNQFNQVPLQDELNFLDSYVNLMKIRLPQNVDVVFTTNLLVPDLKIRPLMFIPLVENAFKHGVSPTEPSFVNICIKTEKEQVEEGRMCDTITCDIKNSNYPKTNQDRSGHGIGLMQTQRRLELAYPNRFEWVKGVSDDGNTYQSTIKIRL